MAGSFVTGSINARARPEVALERKELRVGVHGGLPSLSKRPLRTAACGHGGTHAKEPLTSIEVTTEISLMLCLGLFWGARGSPASRCKVPFVGGERLPLGTAAAIAEQHALLTCDSKMCVAGTSIQLEKRHRSQM